VVKKADQNVAQQVMRLDYYTAVAAKKAAKI
jgi:hypothetical protein